MFYCVSMFSMFCDELHLFFNDFDVRCKSRRLRLHGAVGTPGASGSLKPWLAIGYDYGLLGCDRDHDHFRHVF